MALRETEKALRYISYLDTARCNGEWEKIPELTRKIAKHAPHRKCLVTTAKAEAQVAEYALSSSILDPPTEPSTISDLIAPLLNAIDEESQYPEDVYQATICLGWIHWVLREPALAAARLPEDMMAAVAPKEPDAPPETPTWIHVCVIKGAYMKGFALEKTQGKAEGSDKAFEVYKSTIPYLSSLPISLGSYSSEFRVWTERMLSRMVAVSMKFRPLGEWVDLESMLQMFHLWVSLFRFHPTNPKLPLAYEPPQKVPSMVELGLEVDYSRWDVWMAYYETLSEILGRGCIYSPAYADGNPEILHSREGLTDDEYLTVRLRQRTELKKVESSIETKLLDETRFPKANERNSRVERWVDVVMVNWRIMCGPTWHDEELGEGGKNAVARGILDILYRAATKSFNSTQILRCLFSVHAYVAEFDLAFKAFDSYSEIVQRGRDREEKGGEPDYSLDNDDTVLHTSSEAVRLLCRFGSRKEAEKAREICAKLEQLLEQTALNSKKHRSRSSQASLPVKVPASPRIIAETYRALGTCEARWARLTYDAASRNGHQQQAVDHFRTGLDPQYGNTHDLDTKFSLALVLAEMRELSPAIKIVKQTLAQKPPLSDQFSSSLTNGYTPGEVEGSDAVDYARERKLIPFWHLLSLLLTAKADLITAVRSSNAAFEQFDDLQNLFGPANAYRSEHLTETEKTVFGTPKALIDRMERFEKEGIIQVRITQIALMEVLESPMEAIDASAELLALYARLFGDPKSELLKAQMRMTTAKPPKASNTFRHSILSRAKSRRRDEKTMSMAPSLAPSTIAPTVPSTRPSTMATTTATAPTIQVTNEDGTAPRGRQRNGNRHSIFRNKSHNGDQEVTAKRHSSRKLQKRDSRSNSRHSPESIRPMSATTANDTIREESHEHRMPQDRENHVMHEEEQVGETGYEPRDVKSGTSSTSLPGEEATPMYSPPRPSSSKSDKKPKGHELRDEKRSRASSSARGEDPTPIYSPQRPSSSRSDKKSIHSFSSPRHSLRKIPHNFVLEEGLLPLDEYERPPKQDIKIPGPQAVVGNLTPEPVFPSLQERRHKVSLLIELWLFIGELYVRGGATDDAKGAFDEAADLVQALETEVALESSSVKAFSARGWGCGKSVEDLWGDVWARRGKLAQTNVSPYEAMAYFEKALAHSPDHPLAIVGLSELLLDIYCQKMAPEPPEITTFASTSPSSSFASRIGLRTSIMRIKKEKDGNPNNDVNIPAPPVTIPTNSPEELNRVAARDRAYGLLSTLTKLGTGWDYSEAWFALARAHEESGQIEKAKSVLWWCVELEDTRPLRHWRNIRTGGFGVV